MATCDAATPRANTGEVPNTAPGHHSPPGGDQMQRGMVLAIAPRRVQHHAGATLQCLAPDLAKEIIHASGTTSHQRTQHDRSGVLEGRAQHGRDRQDEVAIDHPLGEPLADLAHPVVNIDFGTAQAQRRFTAHRDEMFALATVETAVCDSAYRRGMR
jgi:hypothetical protein